MAPVAVRTGSRVHRNLALVVSLLAVSSPAAAQAPEASISAEGTVRVCDPDGQNIDSMTVDHAAEGNAFISRLTERTFQCISQPQTTYSYQSADPDGDALLGYRMVSQSRIAVTAEPQFTHVSGMSSLTRQLCFGAFDVDAVPRVGVWLKARASRSLPENCLDEYGRDSNLGACSSVKGRFGGLGDGQFVNSQGTWSTLDQFVDLTTDANKRWFQGVRLIQRPFGLDYELTGSISGTMLTKVAEAPTGLAFGDLRFYVEVDKNTTHLVSCPTPDAGPATAADHLPFPPWIIGQGDAIADDFTLAISPPTGPITVSQSFDLMLMAATGGAGVSSVAATMDGQDVSGAVAACLTVAGSLHGVSGPILACRGLSGRVIAGFFGTGAHTLAVTLTLADGRTIDGSATWTIVP